ncbi:hypothetical protein [Bacillus sp. UNC41MFS5]|uniref:hypothetical protein n=1 Tax=Bacillus sp. UNC41MFS5 TaxID=1449046 RepID=UPI00047E23DD|nr:hypothetical protein [Bacillus sp. UNC41MFS5]
MNLPRSITKIKINYNTILLTMLFFFMHNCFYLVNSNSKILGIISYPDFLFLYCLFLFLFYFKMFPKGYFGGYFAKVILSIPILIILSSFMASINYGQGILSGILTQRAWLITMFLYFPLMALVRNGKLNIESFLSILYTIVFIELFLYFVQFYVGESYMFLHVLYNYRYGSIRLYTDTAYMSLLLSLATVKFMNKEKILKNAFFIAAILAYIFIVIKGRGASIFFLLTFVLIIVLSKSKLIYKICIMVIMFLLGFYIFLQAQTVQELISIIFQNADDPTFNVRIFSQQFYLSKLSSTAGAWAFGYGYPNSTIPNSMAATGNDLGYLLADNGIYGFVFCYGFLGVVWFFYSSIVQIKYSAILFFKYKDSALIVSIVLGLATLVTNIVFFYSFYSFSSVLVFITIELLLRKYRDNNKVRLRG